MVRPMKKIHSAFSLLFVFFAMVGPLGAQEEAEALSKGDTAWMLTATVLVLFMTLPGLALFYGGLVRGRNVLSVLMHCFALACLMSVVWVAVGYSLAFKGDGEWVGDLSAMFLKGVGVGDLDGRSFPETVFIMFQMTFAIITPGLIVGAFVERIKFSAVLIFSTLWLILVYAPATKLVWGGGWMMEAGVIDLAGGIVVHATAGVSALVLAAVLGPRRGFPKHLQPPHNPGMVMIGASMLWVGWFGFNAGSQTAANGAAGMTMLVTHISASVAALTWAVIEKLKTGKPGLVGIVTGMVAGMATITPASGGVGPMGAMIIGFLAGFICYFMCGVIRNKLKIDDSLDVFAVHGVGGIMGTLLVAFLAQEAFGGMGLAKGMTSGGQFLIQLKSVGIVAGWSGLVTFVLAIGLKKTIGLRVGQDAEEQGLDQASHGETAYTLDS